MAWVIASFALVALGLAAFAGLGRFGEMPDAAVTDRPKGHLPDGPVTPELLAQLRLPRASTGYAAGPVDGYLANLAAGKLAEEDPEFPIVRGGYDMQAVDHLIARPRYERPIPAASQPQEPSAR